MYSAQAYRRVQSAIDFLQRHFRSQPTLDDVAAHVSLSPYHFQRLFLEWAGTSPKKFLQFISLSHAKDLLKEQRATLLDAALDIGLSGPSRLHDLFVNIEGMTPGEYKNGGERLSICHSTGMTPFGPVLVASTERGICHLAFYDNESVAVEALISEFPNARFHRAIDASQSNALLIFQKDWRDLRTVKLHLKGSPFQLKIWETLLTIPLARLTSYGAVAQTIGSPGAARAVGSAIGDNPVAYLIPCHRVIRASGALGGYRWGSRRKLAMIGWEGAVAECAMVDCCAPDENGIQREQENTVANENAGAEPT